MVLTVHLGLRGAVDDIFSKHVEDFGRFQKRQKHVAVAAARSAGQALGLQQLQEALKSAKPQTLNLSLRIGLAGPDLAAAQACGSFATSWGCRVCRSLGEPVVPDPRWPKKAACTSSEVWLGADVRA